MTSPKFDKGTFAIYITGLCCMLTYMVSLAIWG